MLIHFLPLPGLSRSFRPARPLAASTCFPRPHHFHNHPQPSPSRLFRPTRSLAASWLISTFHFSTFISTAWTQSVIPAHSVFGGLHSRFHSPLMLFHCCLDSVGHSGPLSRRLPLIHWLLPLPFSTFLSGNLLVSFLSDSVVLSFPSYSVLLTPAYLLYARDSVTGSPDPRVHFVSSLFSARRPVAMGIQSDLRRVATNVDPK